jgi:hypothetical protein
MVLRFDGKRIRIFCGGQQTTAAPLVLLRQTAAPALQVDCAAIERIL